MITEQMVCGLEKAKELKEKGEIWKDIRGYETLYQVSSWGRIRRLDRIIARRNHPKGEKAFWKGRVLRTNNLHGYRSICLCKCKKKKTFLIHRLVTKAFIPNLLNKLETNHINGNKTDNRVENLEWCSPSENKLHSYRIGTSKPNKGENHPMAKLNEKSVKEIRYLLRSDIGQQEIAQNFGVSFQCISDIKNGRRWAWLV